MGFPVEGVVLEVVAELPFFHISIVLFTAIGRVGGYVLNLDALRELLLFHMGDETTRATCPLMDAVAHDELSKGIINQPRLLECDFLLIYSKLQN